MKKPRPKKCKLCNGTGYKPVFLATAIREGKTETALPNGPEKCPACVRGYINPPSVSAPPDKDPVSGG